MCTLTWRFEPDASGYCLLFNRDELKTRRRALPPAIREAANGVSFLAPTDADAGGTWLATNSYGITVCLLNNYAAKQPDCETIHSRGEIVVELASSRSVEELEANLKSLDLHYYRGFEIVVFHHDVRHWRWDAETLTEEPAEMPITSSSYDTDSVQCKRRQYFKSLPDTGSIETLKYFHQCHIDDHGNPVEMPANRSELAVNSVCMHRDIAQTVSQCLVSVREQRVSFEYTDGSPCAGAPVSIATLDRRQVA